jgi:hypothetical protein
LVLHHLERSILKYSSRRSFSSLKKELKYRFTSGVASPSVLLVSLKILPNDRGRKALLAPKKP